MPNVLGLNLSNSYPVWDGDLLCGAAAQQDGYSWLIVIQESQAVAQGKQRGLRAAGQM